jgi:hypothetical protein
MSLSYVSIQDANPGLSDSEVLLQRRSRVVRVVLHENSILHLLPRKASN